ncbi:Ada metal-binding domain-containing protein [Prosthecochloris sp. GSB1]|uniref:sunset domain-containing protein n=1 Tax=Prosthecochloris sp. GSB1 TaxID=281093 RepID=UPI000B8CC35D|nr:Ada metal-binding domain-containing protein [Prosthecochloris sp. GSB1]ASQ91063.1 Ada metal-binding domain-containing protein [Prosthecochloris sp. GSB1]
MANCTKEASIVIMRIRRRPGFLAAPVLFMLLQPISVAAEQSAMVYRGNASSKVFHRPGCRYYDCSACTAEFQSRERALQAGYRPCKVCKP